MGTKKTRNVDHFMKARSSGILLHPTSLPGPHGIGEIGPEAFEFVDFLAEAKQKIWQFLPLGPTSGSELNSPYSALSAFGGNPLLISLADLRNRGLLSDRDLRAFRRTMPKSSRVEYKRLQPRKKRLLETAYAEFRNSRAWKKCQAFSKENFWVRPLAAFLALHDHFKKPRQEWPLGLRTSEGEKVRETIDALSDAVEFHIFEQYIFHEQWMRLAAYAAKYNVRLIGDIPIYVSNNSVDAWNHPDVFQLDGEARPKIVSGVPPDMFSASGQLWNQPVYDWEAPGGAAMKWWMARFRYLLSLVDIVRIDHFRGLVGFWGVPAESNTAKKGKWYPGPGVSFLTAVRQELGALPFVVEDLGEITPDVEEVMRQFGLPGTRVLQFGLDALGPSARSNPHHPANITEDCIVYTGTHDNDTSLGWLKSLARPTRKRIAAALGQGSGPITVAAMVRTAFLSRARFCVIPMQDLLAAPSSCRMNHPGTASAKNWSWRMKSIPFALSRTLSDMADLSLR